MRRFICIGLLWLPVAISAQHFFEAGLRGGLSSWSAQTNYVTVTPDGHAGLEMGYSFRSLEIVGFRAGLTLDMHRVSVGKNDYEDSYSTLDVDGQQMQIEYTIGHLRECHTAWSVGIPVQISLTWNKFALCLGPKVVFPFASSWRETAKEAALSVYYPDYENRIYESYPLAASRSFGMENKGKNSLPVYQWWASGELTYTLLLQTTRRSQSSLIVGFYADVCISPNKVSAAGLQTSLIMLSDTRDGLPLTRSLSSVLIGERQAQPLVSNYRFFDVGIKICFAISPYDPGKQNIGKCHCL